MIWYPLKLTTPVRHHVFDGHMIEEALGKADLSEQRVAETWEVSDVNGATATVTNGEYAGKSLRDLTMEYPDEVVGSGWRGTHFPILTKFIDGSGMLPVHVHADDQITQEKYHEPNGKTEAWHILWAAPGTTFLGGIKPGLDQGEVKDLLLKQDYDRVLFRQPLRSGDTVYVPSGTLHSFGPNTLVYEIEQTSNIQQHAMPTQMEDGSPLSREQWEQNIDSLLDESHWDSRIEASSGTPSEEEGGSRCLCCRGPYFTLERINKQRQVGLQFDGCVILSNLGARFSFEAQGVTHLIGRAQTVLLPATLESVSIPTGSEFLISYLPQTSVRID